MNNKLSYIKMYNEYFLLGSIYIQESLIQMYPQQRDVLHIKF